MLAEPTDAAVRVRGVAAQTPDGHLVPAEAYDLAVPLYLALRRRGSGTLPDVCAAVGVSVRAAEPAWLHLESMGLLQAVGSGGTFAPVDPDAAVNRLFEAQRERLRAQGAELVRTQRHAQDIVARFRPAAMRETVGVEVTFISDRHLRAERLRSLHLSSCEEMWSMHPGPLPSDAVLKRSLELDAELIARGLRVRAVYGHIVAAGADARKYLKALADLGVEIRLARQVPFDLLLFDHRTAVMPSTPSRPADPMLVLHGSELMATYIAMYEDVWTRAAPLFSDEADTECGAGSLSDRQRDVLACLAAGLTDDQIGRRMGLSARTVGRIASGVMEQIGALSRFQAGVLAGALGLVVTDE